MKYTKNQQTSSFLGIQGSNNSYILTSSTHRDPLTDSIDKMNSECEELLDPFHTKKLHKNLNNNNTERKSSIRKDKHMQDMQFIKTITTNGFPLDTINNTQGSTFIDSYEKNPQQFKEYDNKNNKNANQAIVNKLNLQDLNSLKPNHPLTYKFNDNYQTRVKSSPSPLRSDNNNNNNHNSYNELKTHEDYFYYGANNKLDNTNSSISNIQQGGLNSPKICSSRAYVNAMKALQDKIKYLEERLKNVNNELDHTIRNNKFEIEKLREKYQNDITLYKNTENILKDKISIIEKQTIDMSHLINKMEKEKDDVFKKYIETSNENKNLEQQINTLNNDKLNLQKDIQLLQNKLDENNVIIQEMKQNELNMQNSHAKEILNLKSEKDTLQNLNLQILERIQKLEKEHQEYKKIYNEHLNELMLKNENLINEISNLKIYYNQQIKDFQKELDFIDNTNQIKINELEQFIETIQNKNAELQELYNLKNKEADNLRKKLDDYIRNTLTSGFDINNNKSFKILNNTNNNLSPLHITGIQKEGRYTLSPRMEHQMSKAYNKLNFRRSSDNLFDEKTNPQQQQLQQLQQQLQQQQQQQINPFSSPSTTNLSKIGMENNKISSPYDNLEKNNLSMQKSSIFLEKKNSISGLPNILQTTPSIIQNNSNEKSSMNLLTEDTARKNISRNNIPYNNPDNSKLMKQMVGNTNNNPIKDLNSDIEKYLYSNCQGITNYSPDEEPIKNIRKISIVSASQSNNASNLKILEGSANSQNDIDPLFNHLATFSDNNNNNNNIKPIDENIKKNNTSNTNANSNNTTNNNNSHTAFARNLSFGKAELLASTNNIMIESNMNEIKAQIMADEQLNISNNSAREKTFRMTLAIDDDIGLKGLSSPRINAIANNQEYLNIIEDIQKLQDQINVHNQTYQDLVNKSQRTQDSKEKASIRTNLFNITDSLNQLREQLLELKKKEQIMTQNRDINNLLKA